MEKVIVKIPDINLKKKLLGMLYTEFGKSTKEKEIYKRDLEKINYLYTSFTPKGVEQIIDLTGLEYAVNLVELEINNVPNPNLNILKNMTKLKKLIAINCGITDIRPLRNNQSLRSIDLSYNEIIDVRPLVDILPLSFLRIKGNPIEDLKPIKVLVNIGDIYL